MIRIRCRTNLDVNETWPDTLPAMPAVGDNIISRVVHTSPVGDKCQVRLKVVSITWLPCTLTDEMIPQIELHLPHNFVSVAHFEAWYDFIRGNLSVEYYRELTDRALRAANFGRPRIFDPGLMHTLVKCIGYFVKPISMLPDDEFGLVKAQMHKAITAYHAEQLYFPLRIEYTNGKQEIIKDLDSLPTAKAFTILEKGVDVRSEDYLGLNQSK